MLTRTIFAVVLFAVLKCCHAQPLPVVTVALKSAASAPVDPSGVNGLQYWWVASDLTTNAVITNWVDRIAGLVWTNGNAARRPTANANGVVFDGATHNYFLTSALPVVRVTNVYCFILMPTNNHLTFATFWTDSGAANPFNINGSSGSDGKPYIITTPICSPIPTNSVWDFLWRLDATTPNYYTNNILTGSVHTGAGFSLNFLGGNGASGCSSYSGTILEMLVWSNSAVIDSTARSNIHYYATNTYKFSP